MNVLKTAVGSSYATARRYAEWLGVDRAVAMTLLGRGWLILATPLTLVFIARWLTPVEQGFYYTFNSMLALQVFFELGLSFVLLQYVSHERAALDETEEGEFAPSAAQARIRSALTQALHWYGVIAALIVAGLIPAGFIFFGRTAGQANVHWRWPWIALVVCTALNLMTVPYASVLQGLGHVAEVAQVRLYQSVGQNVALWVGLAAGATLFTPALASAVSAVLALTMATGIMGRHLRAIMRSYADAIRVSWKHEIWPFQWRIAVSSVCGYVTFQIFNPVIFASRGPVEAGRLGMSLAIANGLSTVAMAWISTKSPEFGVLVARRQWRNLDLRFVQTLRQMMAVCCIGLAAFWIGAYGLKVMHHRLAQRLVDPYTLVLLVGATLVNVLLFAEAIYLRAHREDPFMPLTILIAVMMACSTLLLAKPFGARGIMAGYLATSLVAGLGPGTYIFFKKRREFRESPGPLSADVPILDDAVNP